ncbi:tRNA (guanosine(46)-N7)-methyltransferase TrmB [Erysipelotrichaceae bacterium OH741_COT-311]|nr:tRNA (guanosine(46)-N7)-methyltransferase TrmB [Erysipelotrichaceae bacterium OH741_COT-311]
MRMRKKKWALPFLQEHSEVALQNPIHLKSRWNTVSDQRPIHLEIGVGKGGYINQMALQHPDAFWVGIEKDVNVVCIAVKNFLNQENDNELFITNDASELEQWFDKGEIDVIHLNFSDPWPKKGYRKRRLSSDGFVSKYHDILKENGKIILKTDNKILFEFSVVEILKLYFVLEEISVDFRREEHQEDAITEYEAKFMALNQPIYRAIFKKI